MLEVLVAMLIFSFGLLGLVGLQAKAIGASVDSEDRNRAALMANELASEMWLHRSTTVDAAFLTAWNTKLADPTVGGLPEGLGTITSVAGNTSDIKIEWKAPSRLSTDAKSQFNTRVVLPW